MLGRLVGCIFGFGKWILIAWTVVTSLTFDFLGLIAPVLVAQFGSVLFVGISRNIRLYRIVKGTVSG